MTVTRGLRRGYAGVTLWASIRSVPFLVVRPKLRPVPDLLSWIRFEKGGLIRVVVCQFVNSGCISVQASRCITRRVLVVAGNLWPFV